MKKLTLLVLAAAALFAFGPGAAQAEDLKALQAAFKARYPKIAALKTAGKVGETDKGYVEAVSGTLAAGEQKLVDAENAGRKKLYQMMAKQQEGATPELVGERNAKRNFSKAKPGEHLKKGGSWAKK